MFASSSARSNACARLYCGAWARNWGFVPPTAEEFRRIGAELRQIFDPRCAICAEIDGRIVACAVAIPDINQALKGTDGRLFPLGLIRLLRRKSIIDQVRLLLLGVLPEYRAVGLFPLLICELQRHIPRNPLSPGRVLLGSRGQPRRQSAGRAARRGGTRPIASTRKRWREPVGGRDGRDRIHRPACHRSLVARGIAVRAIVRPESTQQRARRRGAVRAPLEPSALARGVRGR